MNNSSEAYNSRSEDQIEIHRQEGGSGSVAPHSQ